MGLWPYALRTVAATRAALSIGGSAVDGQIEDCVNEASQMIEDAWGRHVVSRGEITEYHPRQPMAVVNAAITFPGNIYEPWLQTGYRPLSELYLNEWPVVSVTSVAEDSARLYPSNLVAGTDYIVSKPTGKLLRIAGSLQQSWTWSWRAVKVVYLGGYQNTAGSIVVGNVTADPVPYGVMRVFDELVAWLIRQRTKLEIGLNSTSDQLGNRVFAGPAYLTPGMMATLRAAGADSALRVKTGERDA